tara:strand:- start:919 stop:1083 length:165 start_codon:yes stop_codon:yes gene_type:complete
MNDVKKISSVVDVLKEDIQQLKKDKKDIIKLQNERDMWKKKYEELSSLYKATWF